MKALDQRPVGEQLSGTVTERADFDGAKSFWLCQARHGALRANLVIVDEDAEMDSMGLQVQNLGESGLTAFVSRMMT